MDMEWRYRMKKVTLKKDSNNHYLEFVRITEKDEEFEIELTNDHTAGIMADDLLSILVKSVDDQSKKNLAYSYFSNNPHEISNLVKDVINRNMDERERYRRDRIDAEFSCVDLLMSMTRKQRSKLKKEYSEKVKKVNKVVSLGKAYPNFELRKEIILRAMDRIKID
jgi:hypothetical protein